MEHISGKVLVSELNSILARCIELLKNPDAAAIHETRKNMKMFRALMRLLKYAIPETIFSRLNEQARDISRLLAGYRDYDSAVEACERNGTKLSSYQKNLNTRVKRKIMAIGQQEMNGLNASALQAGTGIAILKEIMVGIDGNSLSADQILEAYLKMYKKNKQSLDYLTNDNTVEEFHEWRKSVKYLRYQLVFLSPLWPNYCRFMEEELHVLSDLLGNMQDNKLVSELLKQRHLLKKQSLEHYHETMHLLNSQLKTDSLRLGRKVFASSVKSERVKMMDAKSI